MSATVRDYLDEVEQLFLLSPVVHSLSYLLPVGDPGIEDIP
jgi:hypothetical protein